MGDWETIWGNLDLRGQQNWKKFPKRTLSIFLFSSKTFSNKTYSKLVKTQQKSWSTAFDFAQVELASIERLQITKHRFKDG